MASENYCDFHGYHPNSIGRTMLARILQQAWETGAPTFTFIHGHGRFRSHVPFANTNTGWLGLTIRGILRSDPDLRRWMFAKFDSSEPGATTVRLRPNPSPTRSELDFSFLPERDYNW